MKHLMLRYKKTIISIIAGVATFFLSQYGIKANLGEIQINIPWALIFPVCISMAWGWRYGLLSALCGGALYPFLLWGSNGYANIMNFTVLSSYIFVVGINQNLQALNNQYHNRIRFWTYVFVFLVLIALCYFYLFNILISFNPPFWGKITINKVSENVLLGFFVKDSVNFIFLILLSEVLLSLPPIRVFFNLPVSHAMRLNVRIFFISAVTALIIWSVFVLMDNLLFSNGFFIYKPYHALAFFILLFAGNIVTLFLIHFSELRLGMEQLLTESKMRLKKSQAIAHIGSWELDAKSREFIWSQEVYRIFGFEPYEINPSYEIFSQHIHPDDRERVKNAYLSSVNEKRGHYEIEHRIIRNDNGEERYVVEKGENTFDKHGNILKSVGMVHDITEQHIKDIAIKEKNEKLVLQNKEYQMLNKELSETLVRLNEMNAELEEARKKSEESDRLKSAFLANLSHEVRTPMNAIMGFTELLGSFDIDEDTRSEYIQIVKNSCRYLLAMIDDILEISKIDTGQIKINYKTIHLKKFLNEIFKSSEVLVPEEKELEIRLSEMDVEPDLVILTDEVKLRQVLMNLITNAIKYTENGYVELGCRKSDGEELLFFVKDTGIGVEFKDQIAIFQRFYRAGSDINIKKGGAGLGLAISKAYIELMGGTINMESETGKGSVFTVTLPVTKVTGVIADKEAINFEQDFHLNFDGLVLIAEDDDINYLYFEAIMQDAGIKLVRAVNGAEAVTLCAENSAIRMVLMDLKMPVLNGVEATKQIKAFRPDLPIIVQTAHKLSNEAEILQEAGFDGIITKPIDRKILFKVMGDLWKEDRNKT